LIIVDVSASNGAFDQRGDTYQEEASRWTTLPHLRHPVRPETERQTAIRQTVLTKAPVKAETSTIINNKLFI